MIVEEEFILAVEQMRHAQKQYFRTKNKAALESSKRWERQVDKLLKEHRERQGRLFQ